MCKLTCVVKGREMEGLLPNKYGMNCNMCLLSYLTRSFDGFILKIVLEELMQQWQWIFWRNHKRAILLPHNQKRVKNFTYLLRLSGYLNSQPFAINVINKITRQTHCKSSASAWLRLWSNCEFGTFLVIAWKLRSIPMCVRLSTRC